MRRWLRQTFCQHSWVDVLEYRQDYYGTAVFCCRKCGKEEIYIWGPGNKDGEDNDNLR